MENGLYAKLKRTAWPIKKKKVVAVFFVKNLNSSFAEFFLAKMELIFKIFDNNYSYVYLYQNKCSVQIL